MLSIETCILSSRIKNFDEMCKIVVGRISHVSKIDSRDITAAASGIDRLAEVTVFIPFPARLGKPPVQYGEEKIDMDLVKTCCGFPVWLKKRVHVIRIPVYVSSRTITGSPSQGLRHIFPAGPRVHRLLRKDEDNAWKNL